MRFDIHAMARGNMPYVMDVQSEFTSHLETRVVIPVMPESKVPGQIAILHPLVDIGGVPHVLVTHMMTSISRRDLGRVVEAVAERRDEITRALGLLFTGF
jgi:toxin CcdB